MKPNPHFKAILNLLRKGKTYNEIGNLFGGRVKWMMRELARARYEGGRSSQRELVRLYRDYRCVSCKRDWCGKTTRRKPNVSRHGKPLGKRYYTMREFYRLKKWKDFLLFCHECVYQKQAMIKSHSHKRGKYKKV